MFCKAFWPAAYFPSQYWPGAGTVAPPTPPPLPTNLRQGWQDQPLLVSISGTVITVEQPNVVFTPFGSGMVIVGSQVAGFAYLKMIAGQDFAATVVYLDDTGSEIDLTGYSADMRILQRGQPMTEHAYLELSTTNGYITIVSGQLAILYPAIHTSLVPADVYVYQLTITSSGFVTRLLEGTLTVI